MISEINQILSLGDSEYELQKELPKIHKAGEFRSKKRRELKKI